MKDTHKAVLRTLNFFVGLFVIALAYQINSLGLNFHTILGGLILLATFLPKDIGILLIVLGFSACVWTYSEISTPTVDSYTYPSIFIIGVLLIMGGVFYLALAPKKKKDDKQTEKK